MKRLLLLFAAIAALLSWSGTATAETVSPYVVGFDGSYDVSKHDFKVAPGWGHIVDTYTDYYDDEVYIAYERSNAGVGGTVCLYSNGSQLANGNYDLLVTPKVKGPVTLAVKYRVYTNGTSNYESHVEFYKINEANGKLTRGAKIDVDLSEVNTSGFTNITIPVDAEGERIGIRMSYGVWIDNFAATSADIVLEKGLTLTHASTTWVYPDANEQGKFHVSETFTVQNTGELNLSSADENYTVSLVNYSSSNAVVKTVAIPQSLAIGESTEMTIEADIDYQGFSRSRLDIKENISGKQVAGNWYDPVPYAPIFSMRSATGAEVNSGANCAFGMVSEPQTVTYIVRNSGAAPLQVTALTVPTGYSVDKTAPFAVAAHSEQPIVVTLNATTAGIYNGNLELTYTDADASSKVFTIALSAIVRDMSKWFVDFEDQKVPSGALLEDNWSVSQAYINYTYYNVAANSTTSYNTMFITPKLHAEAGEQLSFDVYRRASGSFLNVKYSTDRKTWTTLKEINAAQLVQNSPVNFNITLPEAGDYYIGFEAGYIYLDNIYGLTPVAVAHDVLFESTLPATAMCNHDTNVQVKLANLLAAPETNVTVKYLLNNEVAAQTTIDELKQGTGSTTLNTYNLVFTPYQAGTFQSAVEVELSDGTKLTSEATEIVIGEEIVSGDARIPADESVSTSYSSNVPVNTNYGYSSSNTIYTAEEIGLPAGTKITQLKWKGYRTSSTSDIPIVVWMENTTETTPETTLSAQLTELSDDIKVFDGNYTFRQQGTGTYSAVDGYITIDLATPFVYQGGNLRVAAKSLAGGGGVYATSFETYSKSNTRYARKDTSIDGMSWYGTTNNPVLYIGIEKEASTFSGVLSIDNADGTNSVIADAKVALTSGNVKYEGTTDAEGKYNFTVMQDKLTYTLSTDYSAKNYFPLSDEQQTVAFNGASIEKNLTLTEAVDLYIDSYEAPAVGKVGVAYTATAKVTNYNKTALAADQYVASLYVTAEGEEPVIVTALTQALAEKEQAELTFVYTPATAGQKVAYIKFQAPTKSVQTEEFTIDVEPVHSLNITATLSENGSVNAELTATARVTNTCQAEEAADAYTVKYYVNGEAVAEAEGQLLPYNSARSFNFAFTPHATGEYVSYVQAEFTDGTVFKSEETTLTVSEEVASNYKVVTTGGMNQHNGAPVNTWYRESQAEMVYTAEQIGLAAETAITAIVYKTYGAQNFPVKVWMGNTTATAPVSTGTTPIDVADLTLVYESNGLNVSGGTSNNPNDLVLELIQPFAYQGANLVIFVEHLDQLNSGSVYFKCDASNTAQAVQRCTDNVNEISTKSFSSTELPALSLGYERESSVFSGVLSVNKTDGTNQVIEGATVTLKDENVEYSGTTDNEGKFSFPVVQDTRTYSINLAGIPETLRLLPYNEQVQLMGTSLEHNITLTEGKDFYLANVSLPTTATINNKYVATVDATNYNAETIAAAAYTAKLYFGNEVVAEAESVDIASMETKTYTFTYTPHAEAEVVAHIEFVLNEVQATESVDVTISAESAGGVFVIGEKQGATDTSANVPLYWTYADATSYGGSKTDLVYTAKQLSDFGLKAGMKISSISFTGTGGGTRTLSNVDLRAWVGLLNPADMVTTTNAGSLDKSQYTFVQVMQGETVSIVGSVDHTVTIDLSETPIVWDGQSDLRIYQELDGHGSWGTVNYPYDSRYTNNSFYTSNTSWSKSSGSPIITIEAEGAKAISGKVTTEGVTPVSDVEITLVSDDVIYSGKSDAEGYYSIDVIQNTLTYTLTATKKGFKTYTATVSLSDVDQLVQDIDLVAVRMLTGKVTANGKAVANATVTLTAGDDNYSATTESDGSYSVEVHKVGVAYTLTVVAEGYNDYETTIEFGENDEVLNISLLPYYMLSGTITSARTDAPVANAAVKVYAGEVELNETTDSEGKYSVRIDDPTLTYTVVVDAEGFETLTQKVGPMTANTTLDMQLQTIEKLLSGHVYDMDMNTVSGAQLVLTSDDITITLTTDAEGKYETLLEQPGKVYKVVITAEGYLEAKGTVGPLAEDTVKDFVIAVDPATAIAVVSGGQKVKGVNDAIIFNADKAQRVMVYNLGGRLIKSQNVDAGQTRIDMPAGIYIVNGMKIQVK